MVRDGRIEECSQHTRGIMEIQFLEKEQCISDRFKMLQTLTIATEDNVHSRCGRENFVVNGRALSIPNGPIRHHAT